MSEKRVLVPLAAGFEEIEAVTIIDVLRRASVEVTVAGLEPGPCRASRGVVVLPDTVLDEVALDALDAIALPGGAPGARALKEDARVIEALRAFARAGKVTAAICAAPTVLLHAGLLKGRRATCHPGVRDELEAGGAIVTDARVERDGSILTSQSPGTAMEFAFALADILCGEGTSRELNGGILARV